MSNTPHKDFNFSVFPKSHIDKTIVLKYAFVVFFSRKKSFLVYIYCLYIDKWPNSRYCFINWIVIFYIDRPKVSDSKVVSIKFDPFLGPTVLINISYKNVLCWIREIPEHLVTQEMCDETVRIGPRYLAFVPNRKNVQRVSGQGRIHTRWCSWLHLDAEIM